MNLLKIVKENQVWEVSGSRIIIGKVFSKVGFASVFDCSLGSFSALNILDIRKGQYLG
jgi:hypothetical protein